MCVRARASVLSGSRSGRRECGTKRRRRRRLRIDTAGVPEHTEPHITAAAASDLDNGGGGGGDRV